SRLKVQLKLSISRLRMTQQKDTALAKQSRRSMAQLLEVCKIESAKIRIENIIRQDITTELHEILELYCELLLARSQLLDPPSSASPLLRPNSPSHSTPQCDPGLEEAVRSLIYAAPRTEVKELHAARALLVEKFGKDFALSAMEGEGVAERVLSKLKVDTPAPALVDAYMREIARAYGVHVPGEPEEAEEEEDGADDDEPGDGERVKALETPLEAEDLTKATPPKKLGPASPLRIAPPSPSSENVAPKVKLPGPPELKPGGKLKKVEEEGKKKKDDGPGGKIPDVDELAKRFAALKR
ncbi:Vacuolar protein sorting-associated protein IST1, partial [Diplodia seriata]